MNPIRYSGGKTRAIKHIEPFIKTDKLVSPFFGGGSLEQHFAKKGVEVIGYDVFDILVNFWQHLLNKPERLYEILKQWEPSTEKYEEIKQLLKKWDKTQTGIFDKLETDYYNEDPIHIDDDMGAAYFWYNFNLSYGPMFLGWVSKAYLDPKKYQRMIENLKNYKNPTLSVNLMSFEDSIPKHRNDFLYLDPPYYIESRKTDSDNKMNRGLYPNPNFDVHHKGFDHELMRDLLHKHEGEFVLSYNNCETIREWYSDFEFHYPKWHYSMDSGEKKIGKIRSERGTKGKESHEILIVKRKEKSENVDDFWG